MLLDTLGAKLDFDVKQYLVYNIDTEFRKMKHIAPKIYDTYYGVKIAEYTGYRYDKNRIKNYLQIQMDNLFLLDINNMFLQDLIDSYYTLQLNEHLNSPIDFDINRFLTEIINPILKNAALTADNNAEFKNLGIIRTCIEIYTTTGKRVPEEFVEILSIYIEDMLTDSNIYNYIYITDLYFIMQNINYASNSFDIFEKINNSIDALYSNGYYVYSIDDPLEDIRYTLKALETKKDLEQKKYIDKETITIDINDFKDDKLIFVPFLDADYTELRFIYSGFKILDILNEKY